MGMYVRSIKRKNKDGSEVEYIQLAHNARHPEKGYTRAEVVYSFGRRDQLDVQALKRLVSSLSRFISPEDAQELEAQGTGLKFISSRQAGEALLLKGLWKRIGIERCLSEALKGRDFTTPVGDAIFAMVANRALAPASKLAVEEWAAKETDMTWAKVRAELERLHLGEFLHKDGRILQYTEPTQSQRKILKKLKISIPKRVKSFTGTP